MVEVFTDLWEVVKGRREKNVLCSPFLWFISFLECYEIVYVVSFQGISIALLFLRNSKEGYTSLFP